MTYEITMHVCGIAQYVYSKVPTFSDACAIAARYARIACENGWESLYTITVTKG